MTSTSPTIVIPTTLTIESDYSNLPNGNYCRGGPQARLYRTYNTDNVEPLTIFMGTRPTRKEVESLVIDHLLHRLMEAQSNESTNAEKTKIFKETNQLQYEVVPVKTKIPLLITVGLSIREIRYKGGTIASDAVMEPDDGYDIVLEQHVESEVQSCCVII